MRIGERGHERPVVERSSVSERAVGLVVRWKYLTSLRWCRHS
jgi:hypothetical protein